MKTILTIFLSLIITSSFSQEKVIDRDAQLLKLASVEKEISSIQEKISIIETRAQETPETELPTDLKDVLTDFKAKKMMLENIKISIIAYLEENDGQSVVKPEVE